MLFALKVFGFFAVIYLCWNLFGVMKARMRGAWRKLKGEPPREYNYKFPWEK